jgi:hypothetical protein
MLNKIADCNFSKCDSTIFQNISYGLYGGLAKKDCSTLYFLLATFLNALRNTTQNQVKTISYFKELLQSYAAHMQPTCTEKLKIKKAAKYLEIIFSAVPLHSYVSK